MPDPLAHARSTYLLQHAGQPVEWMPWGEEAFRRARIEDKPIFLSSGYANCHWCHVMAREVFADPETAAFLKEHFIPVKVDRDERPDIDRIYLSFVEATTGAGGWPLSVWMTPGLRPFLGGTYYPVRALPGRPAFIDVLKVVAGAWDRNREQLELQSTAVLQALADALAPAPRPPSEAVPSPAAFVAAMREHFDSVHGGFGAAPKFPRPASLSALASVVTRESLEPDLRGEAATMLKASLLALVRGALHDPIDGGFHRYATDVAWRMPHFEKLLVDQGLIACALADGIQAAGLRELRPALEALVRYGEGRLLLSGGGFASGEDAFSGEHREEGAFYRWTLRELEQVLGQPLTEILGKSWDLGSRGLEPDEAFVPAMRRDASALSAELGLPRAGIAEALDECRRRLAFARDRRGRPKLDETVVAAWNGHWLSGLCRASQALGDEGPLRLARNLAAFVRENLADPAGKVLVRSWHGTAGPSPAFAEDYAAWIQGLIDLFETGLDWQHLEWAVALQETMNERFRDPAADGFYATEENRGDVLLRLKEVQDGAEPAAGSVAALNLARLGHLLGREDWLLQSRRCVESLAGGFLRSPTLLPALWKAADFLAGPVRRIQIWGDAASDDLRQLVRTVHMQSPNRRVLVVIDSRRDRPAVCPVLSMPATLRPEGPPMAVVCEGERCFEPTSSPVRLRQMLLGLDPKQRVSA